LLNEYEKWKKSQSRLASILAPEEESNRVGESPCGRQDRLVFAGGGEAKATKTYFGII
jgi:hypothetical protein